MPGPPRHDRRAPAVLRFARHPREFEPLMKREAELVDEFFEAYMALLTPVILIGGMATGLFTPTEAAAAAVAWALFLGFVWYRTLTARMLVKISMDTIETTAAVLFIVASASLRLGSHDHGRHRADRAMPVVAKLGIDPVHFGTSAS